MMPNRPNSNLSGLTRSDPHPGGLIRAVIQTGRTRGSSATPPPLQEVVSPSPQRRTQSSTNRMENRNSNERIEAHSDHNSLQVIPDRSAVSVRSHTQSHKPMTIHASGSLQSHRQPQRSPKRSSLGSGPAQGSLLHNQGQAQNSPRMSDGSIQSSGQGQEGVPQNNGQPQKFPYISDENDSHAQRGPTQDSSFGQRQTSPQGINSGPTQGQFQGHNFTHTQRAMQSQDAAIHMYQKTTNVNSQSLESNQLQRLHESPGQSSSQGQVVIHSQEQRPGQDHRRQISSSRMNPAVPEFHSNYQRAQKPEQMQPPHPLQQIQPPHKLQTMQPVQSVMVGSQVPQPIVEMPAKSEEKNKMVQAFTAKIKGHGYISSTTQQEWVQEIESISRKYDEDTENLTQEINKNWYELQTVRAYLSNTTENLRHAYGERDRLGAERDSLEQQNKILLQAREKESSENLNAMRKSWKELNDDLSRQLREKNAELQRVNMQHERVCAELDRAHLEIESYQEKDVKFVDAAQVQWMATHPTSTVRSRISSRAVLDPFTSPSVASSSTFDASGTGPYGSPATDPKFNGRTERGLGLSPSLTQYPTRENFVNATPEELSGPGLRRRRPNLVLPTQKPIRGRTDVPNSPWETESSRAFNTEPGDTPMAASRSTALILSSTNPEDPSLFFQTQFADLYKLVEGWAMAYSNTPNLGNDQAIARSNQGLWSFMMNCTYPGQRQDSHSHVMTLLNDPGSRPWFVMRMGIGHIVEKMLTVEPYKNFSSHVRAELSIVKTQLQQRGLSNDARQDLINRRAKAIQCAIDSPNWDAYRQDQLNRHSQQLRDILGPMLNDGANRSQAGNDLGAITHQAWNLSEEMNTAQVTFQVYFPETASKFTASTMIAKDKMDKNPMSLQIAHTRLKLVITPVITMRDDRGATIKAKNLHYATVLTMG